MRQKVPNSALYSPKICLNLSLKLNFDGILLIFLPEKVRKICMKTFEMFWSSVVQ